MIATVPILEWSCLTPMDIMSATSGCDMAFMYGRIPKGSMLPCAFCSTLSMDGITKP